MNGYFFDMDGTLYNNRFHEVSEKTFKMLNELQSQGLIRFSKVDSTNN